MWDNRGGSDKRDSPETWKKSFDRLIGRQSFMDMIREQRAEKLYDFRYNPKHESSSTLENVPSSGPRYDPGPAPKHVSSSSFEPTSSFRSKVKPRLIFDVANIMVGNWRSFGISRIVRFIFNGVKSIFNRVKSIFKISFVLSIFYFLAKVLSFVLAYCFV